MDTIKAGEQIPDSWRENETNRYLKSRETKILKCPNCDREMEEPEGIHPMDYAYWCEQCQAGIKWSDVE